MRKKKISLAVGSLTLAVLGGLVQTAVAQPRLEEVIVTARKTEENIQSVPVAISSFSTDDLAKNSIVNVRDITRQTPSLTITPGPGQPLSPRVNMRGQIQNDSLFTLDFSVGIYLDDIYLGRSPGAMLDMFDIDRVEVLKGPQGTLYGRNTTGGAMKIITKKAETSAGYTGYVKGGVGNYSAKIVEGGVNIPLIENRLAMRISGLLNKRDGYSETTVVDTLTGMPLREVDTNDKDTESVRLNVVFDATDRLELMLAGDYSDMQTNNQLSYNINGDVSVDPLTALGVPSVALYTNFERSSRNKLKGVNNRDPWADARTWGGSLTATYTLTDDITAKAIYGHREVDASYSIDVDGTNLPVVQSAQFPYSKQDSIELQLTGSSFDDRLEWATGLYWFNETGGEASEQFAVGSPAIPLGAFLPQTGKGENTSESIYMQASYELTDSVRITAGVRHTMDEKGWEGTNFTVPGPDYSTFICNFQAGPGVSTDPCYSDLTEDYEHTSWTIGVDWQVTDDVMLYLKSSNGYRAGGQNMRGKLTAELQPFGPETVTDIETGLKSTLFNQRLRLNIAAFRSDYEEIQTSIFIPTTNALGEPATATVVTNAGEAVIKGVELEATAALTDYLSANVVGSWLDVEYDDPEVDPLQAPEWKYAVGVTWDQPVAFGSASFNINYSWMDSFWVNPSKTTNQAPNAESPSVGLLNARLTFNIDSIDTTVGIWGTNLEDKRYTQNSLLFGVVDFQTFVLATPMEPRMFGLDVTKRF